MVRLDARVVSVQIVTNFPAQVIIPEPPGWQAKCQTPTETKPGGLTSSATLETRANENVSDSDQI